MKITITKDRYGLMTVTDEGFRCLFNMEHRGCGDWYFWMPGRAFDPIIKHGDEFPLDYFKDACRACYFVWNDKGLRDEVDIKGLHHTIVPKRGEGAL